jgi:hypothetical protein
MGAQTGHPTKLESVANGYCVLALVIYLSSSLGKLTSDFSLPMMDKNDAFFWFLSNRQLIIFGGILELLVVIGISVNLFKKRPFAATAGAVCFALLLVIYRAGLRLSNPTGNSCICFGVGSLFSKASRWGETAADICLTYLLLCGIGIGIIKCALNKYQTRLAPLVGLSVVWVGLAFADFASAEQATNSAIEFQGIVTKVMFLGTNGAEKLLNTVSFKWYQEFDGKWAMEASQQTPGLLVLSGFNGKDIFVVYYPKDVHSASSAGVIAPGASPPWSQDWSTYLLWFAFLGSQNYEDSPVGPFPPLQGGYDGNSSGYIWDMRFKRSSDRHEPISEAEWVLNNSYLSYSNLVSRPETVVPNAPSEAMAIQEYLDDVKSKSSRENRNSRYYVKEFLTIEGKVYPHTAYIDEFSWDTRLPKNALLSRTTVLVTNASSVPLRPSVLPQLTGTITVNDLRYRTKIDGMARNDVHYTLTNEQWAINTNDDWLRIAVKSSRFRPIASPGRSTGRGHAMLFIFFVILLCLLPFVLTRGFRSKSIH